MGRIKTSLLIYLCLSIASCYEPQEGCLDIQAVNYDFSADENVPEDCQYPDLLVNISHIYSTPDTIYTFRLNDSVYLDRNNHPFIVGDLRFYISNFRLLDSDGVQSGIEENLVISIPQTNGTFIEQEIEDNYAIASPAIPQTFTIGTQRESFLVSGFRFTLGIEGITNNADPALMPDNHPLSYQDSTLYFSQDSGYVFNYISLFRDTTAADTIPEILRIGTTPYLQEFTFTTDVKKNNGVNFQVNLQVDYSLWFAEIDVVADDPATLIEKISNGIANSFSIVSIQ
jgi:hypothetical protein